MLMLLLKAYHVHEKYKRGNKRMDAVTCDFWIAASEAATIF